MFNFEKFGRISYLVQDLKFGEKKLKF